MEPTKGADREIKLFPRPQSSRKGLRIEEAPFENSVPENQLTSGNHSSDDIAQGKPSVDFENSQNAISSRFIPTQALMLLAVMVLVVGDMYISITTLREIQNTRKLLENPDEKQQQTDFSLPRNRQETGTLEDADQASSSDSNSDSQIPEEAVNPSNNPLAYIAVETTGMDDVVVYGLEEICPSDNISQSKDTSATLVKYEAIIADDRVFGEMRFDNCTQGGNEDAIGTFTQSDTCEGIIGVVFLEEDEIGPKDVLISWENQTCEKWANSFVDARLIRVDSASDNE